MSRARNLAMLLPDSSGKLPVANIADGNTLQSGDIAFFARSTAPTGYLKANGAAVSRTTYAVLFAAIGTGYGTGDGSTTFNVPDMRGEFPRGWDDGRGVDSGRSIGTVQSSDNLSHSHTITADPHTGGYQYPPGRISVNRGYPLNLGGNYSHVVNTASDGNMPTGMLVNSATGSGEARPRNVALLACIKY